MRPDQLNPHLLLSRGWFASAPNAVLAVEIGVFCAALFLIIQVVRWYLQASPTNPFSRDDRLKLKPYETDQKKRDSVLKQGFRKDKVPEHLDAIVIGSGISGLTTAAVLAKAGRKVLVLEQHDQAGGSCHTFIDHGYEFDVGIHYLGADLLDSANFTKFFLDQVSNGQITFSPMDRDFDVVCIGNGDKRRQYPIRTGLKEWEKLLNEQFPGEESAIRGYFQLLKESKNSVMTMVKLKLMPLWLSKLIVKSRLIHLMSNLWSGKFVKSTEGIINELTANKELRLVLSYIWGTYATQPDKSHFLMNSLVLNHYARGASYPNGGSSEIAFNIVPVIERSGGKVLVRANVDEILHNGDKVIGVRVKRGEEKHDIYAPLVVSSAGLYNTFQRLLSPNVAQNSYFSSLCSELKPGVSMMTVFLGLNASSEELNLPRHNYWTYCNSGSNEDISHDKYFALNAQEVQMMDTPAFYISFPSAKDGYWNKHEGRQEKSTCIIISFASWKWFEKFRHTSLKKRGDEYEEFKNRLGHILIEQACELVPQMKRHIDFTDIGTPMTYNHYLGQSYGEVYGLDHNKERFDPMTVARLRPQTDIRGLYLTGQDIMFSGFVSNLYAGLLTAGSILNRNVLRDLGTLFKQLKKESKLKRD